nr:immunoglobulin heavy chain junction region [Macaca mulatta]MOW19250.1 immunoglobulin heavy chain junction region [Macaca mulatta]MOW19342.1 immunoglobulin heavy chain junction region [Macaca mulatta]MOW19482.1 immunoglobulin heavy chain junction region [Macaca mulatta]MOW19640.1 immunoglobulin heavy chain junction region [Macaca mulatta]
CARNGAGWSGYSYAFDDW